MKKIYSILALAAVAASVNAQSVATFDDLELAPESAWYGDLDDEDYMMGTFSSGGWDFNNLYMADWATWSFFSYSNHTATTFDNASFMDDQFNSCVGHGFGGSENYAVAYVAAFMGKTVAEFNEQATPAVVKGMYITNTAWTVDAILNGDGYSDAFGEGDWISLIVQGTVDGEAAGDPLTFYLADYRSANPDERGYLKDWTWVSLEELGEVNGLTFDIQASRSNAYGPTTPTYFCLDNLGAEGPSAIDAIAADSADSAPRFYNLQGVEMQGAHLAPGVYIERRGAASRKIYVK